MSFVPPPYENTYVVAKALISLDSLLLKKMFLKLYSYDGSTVQYMRSIMLGVFFC